MKAKFKILVLFSVLFLASFIFAECGDGIIDAGEQCDKTNFGNINCRDLDKGFLSGHLACTLDCKLDTSNCLMFLSDEETQTAPEVPNQGEVAGSGGSGGGSGVSETNFCGDGKAAGKEECDRMDFKGETCKSIGYASGELFCTSQCIIDLSNCQGMISNDNNQNGAGPLPEENSQGGLIEKDAFPVSNLFSASATAGSYLPEALAIVCGIWAIMMSLAALKITKRREEEENKKILYESQNKE